MPTVWPCHSSSGLMMGANEISVQCWPNPQPCAGLEVSEGNNCCCCVGKDKPRVPSISTSMENILLYMCSIVVFVRRQFEQSWGRERGTSEDLMHRYNVTDRCTLVTWGRPLAVQTTNRSMVHESQLVLMNVSQVPIAPRQVCDWLIGSNNGLH